MLKVFHFDVYASAETRKRQIQSIFHDQNALRLLGTHPNVLDTGDMFAWEDDKFVLPMEWIDDGRSVRRAMSIGRDKEVGWDRKAAGILGKADRSSTRTRLLPF